MHRHRHRQQIDARRDHANEGGGGGVYEEEIAVKLLPTNLFGGEWACVSGAGWSAAINVSASLTEEETGSRSGTGKERKRWLERKPL